MPPTITLHQAVHNRPEYTRLSIQSIGEHTHYPDLLWIVTAIACDADTLLLLQDLQDLYPYHLTVACENIGQWKACENAWASTNTPLLSHIQNDILVPHGWLYQLQEIYTTFPLFLLGPTVYFPENPPEWSTLLPSGIGFQAVNHIPGTAFIVSRSMWEKYGPIYRGHLIYGFDDFEARGKKEDRLIARAYPPVKILHMDHPDYPYSLRETTYKDYTDQVFRLRHGTPRPPGVYP